jgi:SsrA-binding protein
LPWVRRRLTSGYLPVVTASRKDAQKFIAQNRAATFHYSISDQYEAGIVLRGSEVKSLRDGRVDLSEAYASVERGEVWLRQMHIGAFFGARAFPHEERGIRKLLLHAKEIRYLERCVLREGYTLLPLDLYFKAGRVKVTLGVARGKKSHDKRAVIAARTEEREALFLVRAHRQRASRRTS